MEIYQAVLLTIGVIISIIVFWYLYTELYKREFITLIILLIIIIVCSLFIGSHFTTISFYEKIHKKIEIEKSHDYEKWLING